MNGIKVRVPGIRRFQLTGDIPSPIPFSEAFTVLRAGVIDGVISSGAEEDQAKNEHRLAEKLGTNVVSLSGAELSAMADKVCAEVWPPVLEDVGVEWGQANLDQIGN